jgi:diguanylate cyclase (GGDEF)-like protein
MPRRKTDAPAYKDSVSTMMALLLPVHSAMTLDWLADAAATAAERTLNAAHTFLYFEGADGQLERKLPASDLRRRSLQRAIDTFGKGALGERIDPRSAPAIAEALDARRPVTGNAGELFGGLLDAAAADAAQRELAADAVAIAPLESAGERIGALVMLLAGRPNEDHVRLLADHVACAAVNLRQTLAARETGVIDVVRSVFDARKLESDLARELARAERYKRPVSIGVIEATNLRLLRERFGALLTDRLLQRLGETLAQHSRDIDVIGAYKESGYTMILTEASPEGAASATHRLLATAREFTADAEVPGLELHLAAGWATCPLDGLTTDAIFAAAERRMYDLQSQVA